MKLINYYLYYIYYFYYIKFKSNERYIIKETMLFALKTHHSVNQKYNKKYPYFFHLKMVYDFACDYYKYNKSDLTIREFEIIKIIVLLHDVIEDCRLTYNDVKVFLKTILGDKDEILVILEGVYACTEEKGRDRSERHSDEFYNGLRLSRYGRIAKLCDILANFTYSKKTKSSMYDKYYKENQKIIFELYDKLGLKYNDYFAYKFIDLKN